jgi:branched-chain amino acid transport system ATP-binding protein
MLAIARAIMAKPRLIMLDEASLGLAPGTALRVYEAIARLRTEAGVSMVIVEQNAVLAFKVVDHAIVLETGNVSISGTRDQLMGMDEVRKAYLGG